MNSRHFFLPFILTGESVAAGVFWQNSQAFD